ncbi:MAG: hypothetical protein CFE44_00710 [Burkholderiales bacterium PBB4]|nr:MAG: hypothetical protein CFE44_00710 [Burkholderiales bacterium PBB4]
MPGWATAQTRASLPAKLSGMNTRMLLPALIALAFCCQSWAAPHVCKYENGDTVEVQFPCDAVRVAGFRKRLLELYPEVADISTSPDYITGLFVFSMASCTGHFADMSPQAIGEGGEPFFPSKMLEAMVRAGREQLCPVGSGVLSK